ncbi:MAG: hydroxymethylbilane synthase [Deltaproteobacteria bacterium]|nr:MAG: hydroxymethylbilane synthase [Deltaproteobacteria bacterium]
MRLGTRASPLARVQAEGVRAALAARHPGLTVELVFVRTTGDRVTGPLAAAGGKGLFVKEIEEALLDGRIDAGVHSMKDVPARLAAGLVIGAVPERADARDVLIGGDGGLAGLPPGARIGTASPRRRAQLLAHRPDLVVVLLRGNVDTRLRKWRAGEVDALLLAAAGLARLGISEPAAQPLPVDEFLPAVGQGALALECRADDGATRALLAAVDQPAAATAVAAERAFLAAVGGDCNSAIAAHATLAGGRLTLRALVTDPDGRRRLEERDTAPAADAEALGRTVATRLLAAGAAALMGR